MEEKKRIRKQIFAARKERTDQEILRLSGQIAQRAVKLPAFEEARRILAYIDYNHEVMTEAIIQEAWRQGKEVAVPKVEGKDLIFYKLTDFNQLESGYYGIREPASGEIVDWQDAVMIMPGVAFDKENHRVGYGGGFYDRFLEKHPRLHTIALAFEFQVLDQVPFEATDIRPCQIITEEQILEF